MLNAVFILRKLFCLGIVARILFVGFGAAQEPVASPEPSFDVVSLRRVDLTTSFSGGNSITSIPRMKPCEYLPDRVVCQLTLAGLIEEAYQLKDDVELAGPEWLQRDIYVFQATMPLDTNRETARLMLQRALKDRFGLKVHREKRDLQVYALVPGKHGVRLQTADTPEQQKLSKLDTPAGLVSGTVFSGHGAFVASAITIDLLADNMRNYVDDGMPVVNMTGLTGKYKIDMHWAPTDEPGMKDPEIFSAIERQLGLRLEKRKVPYDVLVADHIERVPTDN